MSQNSSTPNLGLVLPSAGSPGYGSGATETGQLVTAIQALDAFLGKIQSIVAAGAMAVAPGTAFLHAGSAAAITLAAPVAGLPSAGGSDGAVLRIVALDAYAYTVTTPANGIKGANHVMTWAAAAGNCIQLVAYQGAWWPRS